MRRLLLLLPGLLFCGGFGVAPFDADAVSKAMAARQQAIKACAARTDFKSNADVIDCAVTADADFAKAIQLRDARLLADYSGKVKVLETDIGAGTVKPADITTRFRDAQNAFFKAVNSQYVDYQSEMAQDKVREVNDAADRAAQGMKSNSMDSMNGMNGMNGMGN